MMIGFNDRPSEQTPGQWFVENYPTETVEGLGGYCLTDVHDCDGCKECRESKDGDAIESGLWTSKISEYKEWLRAHGTTYRTNITYL